MSKIVDFLAGVGADADLRYMAPEQLETIAAEQSVIALGSLQHAAALNHLVGAAKIVFCGVMRPDEEEEEEEPGKEDDEVRALRLAGAA